MKTEVIDTCFVTLRLPVLLDSDSLFRQFRDRAVGNNEALVEAECIISSCCKDAPISISIVEIDAGSTGDSPEKVTLVACQILELDIGSLVVPSLAQIGYLASFFREELAVKRMIPLIKEGSICGVEWERADWPTPKQPVFRFRRPNGLIHDHVYVMLPTLA